MKYISGSLITLVLVCAVSGQLVGDKRAHIDAVMSCVNKGDSACVVELSTKGIEFYPDDAGFRYTRGTGYLGLGRYSEALADENKALEMNPQFSDAFYIRGLIYETGFFDFDKAVADLSNAVKYDATLTNALAERGKVYKFQGYYDLSVADFTRILAADAMDINARSNLADIADMKKAAFNTGVVKDNVLLLYTEYMRRLRDADTLLNTRIEVVSSAMDEKPVNTVKLCGGLTGMMQPILEIEKNGAKLDALVAAGRFDKIPVYKANVQKSINGYKDGRVSVDTLNAKFGCSARWPQ